MPSGHVDYSHQKSDTFPVLPSAAVVRVWASASNYDCDDADFGPVCHQGFPALHGVEG